MFIHFRALSDGKVQNGIFFCGHKIFKYLFGNA